MTIDWSLLEKISYQTKLGKSLKNTLRKFEKETLLTELQEVIEFYMETTKELESANYSYRVKSLHSCVLKYEKYYPSTEVEKVFNDILGIRKVVADYNDCDLINVPVNVHVADMRNGKARDDGYRGVHIYYQLSHSHYPIEIQCMTEFDKKFNGWLHDYLYKYVSDKEVGIKLRDMYEKGLIVSEQQFVEEMKRLCVC